MNTQKVAEAARFWSEQVHSSAAKALNDAADTIARLTAELEEARRKADKWHRVAMDAGVVCCQGGTFIFTATDRAKAAESRLKALEEENERLKNAIEKEAK